MYNSLFPRAPSQARIWLHLPTRRLLAGSLHATLRARNPALSKRDPGGGGFLAEVLADPPETPRDEGAELETAWSEGRDGAVLGAAGRAGRGGGDRDVGESDISTSKSTTLRDGVLPRPREPAARPPREPRRLTGRSGCRAHHHYYSS